MKHELLTEKVIGMFYTVYNDLGHGFLESIYQKAFTVVLREQALNFQAQVPIQVFYRGVDLGEFFADLVVESTVLVELKAVAVLDRSHEKQVLNYLKATNLEVGLLMNFGPRPQVRRFVLDNDLKLARSAAAGANSNPSP
ncbi:MAG TPA: GxxExxY protein [Terriglobales bacterium]|jgi:GxxExxY protein|nr:GxxExxY protein [Terriglobales bacterium]